MKTFSLRFAPFLLLTLAWALQGAKTEVQFAIWAGGTLAYCFFVASKKNLPERDIAMVLVVLSLIFLTQLCSLDFQKSLFWSFELAVFVMLWPSLQWEGIESFATPRGILLFESLLAVSAIVTIRQMQQNIPTYGLLPINPNFNAAWMTAGAVFLTAKQIQVAHGNLLQRGGEILLSLTLALLVVFGHSRSGLIALLIGFGYIAWYSLPRKWFLITTAGALGTLCLILNSWLLGRFGLLSAIGLRADRLQFWAIALRAVACRPLTGYGLGNFEVAYNQFAFPVVDDIVRYAHTTAFAHNEFLQLLTEMGIPVGGFFILLLGSPFLAPIRPKHPWDLPAKTSLLALGAIAFVNPILHMPLLVYLGLLFASILMQGRMKSAAPSFPFDLLSRLPARTLWACALAGLFSLSGYFFISSIWSGRGQWKQIVHLNPYDGEAWHQLGSQEMDSSERIEAQRQAVHRSPYNLYFREALAAELESSGLESNYPLALQQYLQALVLCPTRAVDALAVGRLLLRAGDPLTALAWFEKARGLEPHYWESDLWIARCYRASGQREKAKFILRDLLIRHAETKVPSNLLGMSPYERAILGFSEQAVKRELK